MNRGIFALPEEEVCGRRKLQATTRQRTGSSSSSSTSTTTAKVWEPPTISRSKTRRKWLQHVSSLVGTTTATLVVLVGMIPTSRSDSVANAATVPVASTVRSTTTTPVEQLMDARDVLETLLQNWKRATIDCTFADVPRELLETKNKELLLEKASTFALFDKSGSVETCKTSNKIVRDYLGATGKGPLVRIEKTLKQGLDYVMEEEDVMENGMEIYVTGTY
jgi:hypothetical protein